MSRTLVALILVNGTLATFILGDLSESARGDDTLLHLIPYDLFAMAVLSALILFVARVGGTIRKRG